MVLYVLGDRVFADLDRVKVRRVARRDMADLNPGCRRCDRGGREPGQAK